MNHPSKGFTLTELIIVIAIIAILMSFAVPAYLDSVSKSRRSDAQGALVSASNAMERYYTQNNSYAGATFGATGIFPNEAPLDGGTKHYDLTIAASGVSSYILQAIPKGGHAGDGRLQVDSLGIKVWNSNDDGTGTNKTW